MYWKSYMIKLEIGLKLEKDIDYYLTILKNNKAINRYSCETHDIYWTNVDLNGLTEKEIKKSCVRLRMTRGIGGKDRKFFIKIRHLLGLVGSWDCMFENYKLFDNNYDDKFNVRLESINDYCKLFEEKGFKLVFDTYKKDYQYSIGNMKSRIQLQDIKDIGLILYYDNPDLYDLPLDKQRESLIIELNSYGFNFKIDELGLDKLRTLYFRKECYSKNQNG